MNLGFLSFGATLMLGIPLMRDLLDIAPNGRYARAMTGILNGVLFWGGVLAYHWFLA